MASHIAYVPWVLSPVARNRYTSPTTAMVRPSLGFLKVGGGALKVPHCWDAAYGLSCLKWSRGRIESGSDCTLHDATTI